MKKKKVLFVATVVKTHIMTFHLPFIKLFHDKGWEVHVAARNDYENKEDCKIPYCDVFHDIDFPRNPFSSHLLSSYKQLKKIAEEEKFSIVHTNTPVGGVVGRLALKHSRKKYNTKVIYQAHGFHFFKGAPLINWILYYPVEYMLSYITDELIVINKEDESRALKFHAKRVAYVPGVGVDTDKIKNLTVNKKEKRESLRLDKDDIVLLSVGELNENKNHRLVIDAIYNSSLKNDIRIKYIICGKGPLKEELENLINRFDLSSRIKLLGYREDIYEIMKISDIFVFPSKREGLPVSVIEAMAAGLPIIASDIRGNNELVQSENGYLYNNENEISEFILKLIDDSKKMGEKSFKISKTYDVTNVINLMNEIYSSSCLE